jgi:hypothetical protein
MGKQDRHNREMAKDGAWGWGDGKVPNQSAKQKGGPCAISALIGLSLLATGAGELFTRGAFL